MTQGNVIIQNVCLKISLGLFKTLLKDLSLKNKKKKEKVTNPYFFFVPKKRETPRIFLNKINSYMCTLDGFDMEESRDCISQLL